MDTAEINDIELGTIKHGRAIGKKPPLTKFQWAICSECGKGRWVRWVRLGFTNKTTLCRSCRGKASRQFQRGAKNCNWKGGKQRTLKGYILVYLSKDDPFYPMTKKDSHVFEHRLVMAKYLNRCLLPSEVVHHKNGIRDDNRLENLELLPAPYQHNALSQITKYVKRLELENRLLRAENEILRVKA